MKRTSETHRPPGRPDPRDPSRPFLTTLDWQLRSALLTCLILGVCGIGSARAADVYDETTRQSLVAAVEAASVVDIYHARCRGDVSGRRMENLNKLLVSKLRITVLTVKDDYFPEHSYRRAEERLEQDFATALRDAGGCQGAKESTLPEQWKTRYEATLDAIRALP